LRLIKPDYEFLTPIEPIKMLKLIELAGRTCYKSEEKITEDSASNFVRRIMSMKPYPHESVIEHASFTVKFIINRGVSHELVRHRLAAYSQESTRYCNYGNKGIIYIIPPWLDLEPHDIYEVEPSIDHDDDAETNWLMALAHAEKYYHSLLKNGWTPEKARGVLPNDLKTEVVATYNLREWRHVFKLRTFQRAHPQMREIMIPLLEECKDLLPEIFDDINT
jgi:thymidylate synthase (FAD)